MDISLQNHDLWKETSTRLLETANTLGDFNVIEICTNAREIHGKQVLWTQTGFSSILGATSKCFASDISDSLIGSYCKYQDLEPHASSPLLDVHWSCDSQYVRHFTSRVSRQEKIQLISNIIPESLQNIRVCYQNFEGGPYNCGKCEKCLRTRVELLLAGVKERDYLFNHKLTSCIFEELTIPNPSKNKYVLNFWNEILLECKKQKLHEFSQAIERAILRNNIQNSKRLKRFLPTVKYFLHEIKH